MATQDLMRRTGTTHPAIYVGGGLVVAGLAIVMVAFVLGIVESSLTNDVFTATKAERDAAAPGSSLLGDIRAAATLKAWLAAFTVLGISSMFAGIAVMFGLGIIDRLKLRRDSMRELLPLIQQKRPGRLS